MTTPPFTYYRAPFALLRKDHCGIEVYKPLEDRWERTSAPFIYETLGRGEASSICHREIWRHKAQLRKAVPRSTLSKLAVALFKKLPK